MIKSPYIPLTAIDCTIPALLIDRNAPLDVLHANANATARVLAVTQLMETFSSREVQEADAVDLKHLAATAAVLLRDGCDLLNVLGRRLQPS
ncbi:short-chain dehydrogenase [Pseudomonas lundensis]|uniref:short-chain dehydrogenase n=1 Tax=Pseudomonas lundensis TaxID=86185 RepID=UPI0018677C3E|nr:short-chain dehydrogenase [Pseudomonas lundensis]